jgi:fumarate reductase subunit D
LIGAPAGYEQRTVIAQVARAVFGGYAAIGFFAVQAFTAAILIFAANTAGKLELTLMVLLSLWIFRAFVRLSRVFLSRATYRPYPTDLNAVIRRQPGTLTTPDG